MSSRPYCKFYISLIPSQSLSIIGYRYIKIESGADAGLRFEGNIAPQNRQYAFNDAQAESHPAIAWVVMVVGFSKGLKNVVPGLLRDPDAGIFDGSS